MVKNEAANVVWGQVVKGLERFARKVGFDPVGNGEPWKVLKGTTLFEKDHSATVWRGTPQEANPPVAPLCEVIALFLSSCSRLQSWID